MNFAGKKAYISNNRANAFVQLQAQRGNQINFASHVPQHIQQVDQPSPLSVPQSQEGLLYQPAAQHPAPPGPPQAQPSLAPMIPPPNLFGPPQYKHPISGGSNNLFGPGQYKPKIKMQRKRSFEMLQDCELNKSLSDEEGESNLFDNEKEQELEQYVSALSSKLSVHNKNKEPEKKKKGFIGAISDKFFSKKKKIDSKQKMNASSFKNKIIEPHSSKRKMKSVKDNFKPIGEDVQECYQKQIDSNVMSINFNVLKETGEIASGDPIICKQCGSIFNKFSKLIDQKALNDMKKAKMHKINLSQIQEQLEDSMPLVDVNDNKLFINQEQKNEITQLEEQEEKKEEKKEQPQTDLANVILQSDQQLWVCEFCHFNNIVQIEEQEVPTTQGVNYILQSQVQAKEAAVGKAEHQDISIIFCVDISGSMCLTQEVKGKMKLKGMDNFKQVAKDLLKFGDGSDQFLQGESKNATYISRMQCLQAAIDSQIQQMSIGAPKRLVGIVTFGSQVAIIGDGTQGLPRIIAGDRLNDADFIKKQANKCISSEYLKKPIGQTSENLAKQVMMLEEGGSTALGPALLSAIEMATTGKRGSKVVVCTDGLANMGIGSLEELKSDQDHNIARKFYQNCGTFAKDNGVEVSVISIKGQNCKLEYLTNIATESGGEVLIVDPQNLAEEFSNILQNPVIATHVQAKVLLSKVMEFRNEKAASLTDDKSTLVREIGNVTEQTQITFEYTLKNAQNLQKVKGVNIFQEKELAFQTQITYTALDGKKCVRVISSKQEIGFEKEQIQQNANVNILATHVQQQSAAIAKEGNYRQAQANMHFWGKKIKSSVRNEEDNHAYGQWKQSANLFSHNLQSAQVMESEDKFLGSAAPSKMLRGQMRSDSLSHEINMNSNFQKKSNKKSMGQRFKEFFSKKK